MRAAREQPRLVLAKIAGAICLILVGIALGFALDGGDANRIHATRLRLVSAQRSLADDDDAELCVANDRAARAGARARSARASARALSRSNRRLRDELVAAKRARRHTTSKGHQ